MNDNLKKARGWIGIFSTLLESKYLSIGSFIELTDLVSKNYKISSNDMIKLINITQKDWDKEVSEAGVHVSWKNDELLDQSTKWAGIIAVLKEEKYLNGYGVIIVAKNVSRTFNLTWEKMAEKINYALKNIDLEKSYAYVDVHWK